MLAGAAGAQQVGAGAQQVGAGAQQVGAGVQQVFFLQQQASALEHRARPTEQRTAVATNLVMIGPLHRWWRTWEANNRPTLGRRVQTQRAGTGITGKCCYLEIST